MRKRERRMSAMQLQRPNRLIFRMTFEVLFSFIAVPESIQDQDERKKEKKREGFMDLYKLIGN